MEVKGRVIYCHITNFETFSREVVKIIAELEMPLLEFRPSQTAIEAVYRAIVKRDGDA